MIRALRSQVINRFWLSDFLQKSVDCHVGCGTDIKSQERQEQLYSEDDGERSQHHRPRAGCDLRSNAFRPVECTETCPENNEENSHDQFNRGERKIPKKVVVRNPFAQIRQMLVKKQVN